MPFFGRREQDDHLIDALFEEGRQALSEGDTRRAFAIAKDLHRAGSSAAFEIEARALWDDERDEEAIKVLERGVRKFPEVAALWSYLGHFYSDCGLYEEALEAFQHSAVGHGGRRAEADYNIAIVMYRLERYEEALAKVNLLLTPEVSETADRVPAHVVEGLAAYLYIAMGRLDDAEEAVRAAREACDHDDPYVEQIDEIEAAIAQARAKD